VAADCAPGLSCVYGVCRPFCAEDKAACSGSGLGKCSQYYDAPNTPVPNAKFCTLTCDLRNPSAACGSNTCVWHTDLGTTDCQGAGTIDVDSPCTTANDCKPGLACAEDPLFGSLVCKRWCRIGNPDDCSPFGFCLDVGGPTQGGSRLGQCN
jgi:hypothetical protein